MTEPTTETTETTEQTPPPPPEPGAPEPEPAVQPPAHPPTAVIERVGFDVGSFLSGLLFLALGVAFLLEAAGEWTFRLTHFRYVGPLVLVIIGLAILVGTGLSGRRQPE